MTNTGGLRRTAEVAIVGGGIVGLSIAYHLARSGVRATLIERGRLGEGSTAKSSGGIRRLFASEPAVRLSLESVRFWERFEEELGTAIDWHRVGYLLVARSPAQHSALEAAWRLQQRFAVPSVVLTAAEIGQLVPAMRVDDVLAGVYCATDGYAGPYEALQAFRAAALRLGGTIVEGCEVAAVRVRGGRVVGLDTSQGRIDTPVVVNAAGVWAPAVARLVGVEFPIAMFRRHQWIVETRDEPFHVPCTIDMDSTLFVRPEGRRYLLGIGGERPTHTYELTVDPEAFGPVAALALDRFPPFRTAGLARAWAGLTQETPDRLPVLGPAGPEGFVLAAGFSQGFMHAPAAGAMIAEYITTRRSRAIPMEPFRASRFEGRDQKSSEQVFSGWETH